MGNYVSWSEYSNYLKEYHCRNVDAIGSIAALAQTCLKSEEQLVSEWSTQIKSENLHKRKSVVLSCLIHQRVDSFIHTGCIISDVSGAALLCIAKEADLTCQLLRYGADTVDHDLIDMATEIRTWALGLMNCTSDNSVAASAVLLCINKEADLICELLKHGAEPFDDIIEQSSVIRMCALGLLTLEGHQSISAAAATMGMVYEAKKICDWIKREKKLVTLSFSELHDLEECRLIRIKALGVMTSMLQDASFPCPKTRDDDATACGD